MALDVSGLSNFTKEDTREPIVAAMLTGTSEIAKIAEVHVGVKSAIKIPLLDDTVWFADGSTKCATVSPSGDTTITQFTLTPGEIKIEKDYCVGDLEPKFTQAYLKPGANYTEADLPKWIVDITMAKIQEKFLKRDWYAITAADRYTGLATYIETAAGSYAYNVTATAVPTTSNIISIVQEFYQNIPAQLASKPDKVLWMGYENYRLLATALVNINWFNNGDATTAAKNLEFMFPGTDFLIKVDHGLNREQNAKNRMYLICKSNIHMVIDGQGDDSTMDIWFEKKEEKIYARMRCKRGFGVARKSEVMRYSDF